MIAAGVNAGVVAGANWTTSADWTLVGGVQVTRSIGDADVKGDGLTAEPEVFTRQLSEADEFLVMACDGLWDTLSNQQVGDDRSLSPC
eukprot:6586616-Pyramimonas_sp.AAC.2